MNFWRVIILCASYIDMRVCGACRYSAHHIIWREIILCALYIDMHVCSAGCVASAQNVMCMHIDVCSVLWVAVSCSELQCVAVSCSELQ